MSQTSSLLAIRHKKINAQLGHTQCSYLALDSSPAVPRGCADQEEDMSLAPVCSLLPWTLLHHHSCTGGVGRSILACSLYCLFMDPLSLDLSNPFLNLLVLSACGRCYRSSLWQQIPEVHYSLSSNVPYFINFK